MFSINLGADAVISSAGASAGLFEKALTGPEIYSILTLGGNKADVVEVTVKYESDVVGKTIEELKTPELCTVAMVTRDDKLTPPRGYTEFKDGDRVILAGESSDLYLLSKIFRGLKTEGFLMNKVVVQMGEFC